MIESILTHLTALVGFDTQNPPRRIQPDAPLYAYLATAVGADFDVELVDHGRGRVSWFARRGEPGVLFNAHLDTVPAGAAWSADPFRLSVQDGRAVGLGACDIKGAAACLLAMAQHSAADLAILLTSDEEGNDPCCVQRFVEASRWKPKLVVVAEPTGARVVSGHRGYLSRHGMFTGASGHTSLPAVDRNSAVHELVAWSAEALRTVAAAEQATGSCVDFCFNLGTISGGEKNNVVAERAEVRWSARLPAGANDQALLDRLAEIPQNAGATWQTTFRGPSLPHSVQLRSQAQQYLAPLNLPSAADVDFWTEAALFSAAGWPAIVLGPGEITQAHTADEWVGLDQLQRVYGQYSRIAHVD